jgi:hypothetical protein
VVTPAEPSWCVRTVHDDSSIGRHFSADVRAGERRDRGEVAARLMAMGAGPTWVDLSVAHMAYASVGISLADAAKLRDGLTALLELAGFEQAAAKENR